MFILNNGLAIVMGLRAYGGYWGVSLVYLLAGVITVHCLVVLFARESTWVMTTTVGVLPCDSKRTLTCACGNLVGVWGVYVVRGIFVSFFYS